MSKYSAIAIDGCAKGELFNMDSPYLKVPIKTSLKPYNVTDGHPDPLMDVQQYYFHELRHPDGRTARIWSIEHDFNETCARKHLGW